MFYPECMIMYKEMSIEIFVLCPELLLDVVSKDTALGCGICMVFVSLRNYLLMLYI